MKNLINLDCENELEEFYQKYAGFKGTHLAGLLGIKGKGAANKANSLLEYAIKKRAAIVYRKEGRIDKARQMENWCDSIYGQMSDDIKW